MMLLSKGLGLAIVYGMIFYSIFSKISKERRRCQYMMYAVVDLEATSVPQSSEKRIIQIGITFIEDDTIQDTLCIDINPMTSIDKRVVELTGITDEQVKDAPIFEDVAEYIYTLLEGCVFVAHNIHFDYTLLKEAFKSVGYDDFAMVCVDTIELAKIIYPTQESYNLGQLALAKKLMHPQEHHAGSDSRVTAELFLLMKRDITSLPQQLLDNVLHLLKHKEDTHAFLFDCVSQHDSDTVIFQTSSDSAVQNVQTITPASSTQQEIVTLIHHSNYVALEEVNPESDLETVLPALYSSDNVMIYVSPHRSHTQMIEKVLRDKQLPVEVFYPIYHYINERKIEHIFEHVSHLTVQEVRQLCRVLVSMYMMEEPYQCVRTQEINMRLLYWIGGMSENDEYPTGYMKQLASILPHTIVIIEQQTLLEQINVLQQMDWFENSRFFIPNVYKWADVVQKNTSMLLYHTQHIQHLFGLLQRIQDTQYLDKESHILQVETVIEGYQTFLKHFQKNYTMLFADIPETSVYQTSFVDSVANSDFSVFEQFKKSVRLFKELLEKYDRYKYKLHKELDDQLTLLNQLNTMNRAYIVLTTQRKKYIQYSLSVEQYSTQEWLLKTVYKHNPPVIYTTIRQVEETLDTYLVSRLHDNPVYYVNVHNHAEKNKIYVPHTHDTSVMKDNLIMRKIKALNKKWQVPIVCIVPSVQFLEKILEYDAESYTAHMHQSWMKQTEKNLYLTWEQWRQYDFMIAKGQKVVILKLPFESPYSVSAQAYQFFEGKKKETYFERISLPKMLMQLQECASSVTTKGGCLIVLDHRIVNSVYQDEISKTLSGSFVLEKVDIESLNET